MTDLHIDDEEARALARASAHPDTQSGDFDEERDRRLYRPLVRRGLLVREVMPYPNDDAFEIVHYEATALGLEALEAYQQRSKR